MAKPATASTPTAIAMRNDATPEKRTSIWPVVWRELCWLSIPAALAVAAWLALQVDCAVSNWWPHCLTDTGRPKAVNGMLSFVHEALNICVTFGDGLGVAILILVVLVLDRDRRWALPRLLCCAYGAGLAANGLKLLLARKRPHSFDFTTGDVWTTFGAWLPGTSVVSKWQSFPSAHTATAIGFAAGLAWLYPRGRWLFLLFAALVGCQRIESGAHFPSDVLAGAALGSLIALAFLKCGLLPGWMDRLEIAIRGEQT
jgi:membrane-associated phospholipid phosphatase